MARILVICLVSACVLALGCNGHEVEPVNLNLEFSGDPPSIYDWGDSSRFEVSFRPYNDPGLSGNYLWMFFKLQIDTVVFYESNDIMFPLSVDSVQTDVYTLEFGGAIEGENFRDDYHIVGGLALVQIGQEPKLAETESRYLRVYQKTYFSKTMHIEYDCQSSYNIGADTLDTFAKLAAAFHVADTDTALLWDELSMRDSAISEEDLGFYHFVHWSSTFGYNMHVLGIRGLTSNPNHLGGKAVAGPFGWSFVFFQDIYDHHTEYPELALSKVTVHELGHQRGNLTHASGDDPDHPPHPELHDSPFCVMNQDLSYEGNNDNDPNNDPPGLKRWFDTNPHFCDMCVNAIRNVNW